MFNKNDYPKNWKEIRERILKRANNCCEMCGIANYAIKQTTGTKVVLTIAHLDHDKHNCEVKDERLKALCQACHLNYDMPIHKENRKKNIEKKKKQIKLF